ncbi:MAG TPA: ABC transporter permease, partial [Rhodocyclaceae bacterium]|nr:ABC transporter permease [Rhodocyclaceae bacterium]
MIPSLVANRYLIYQLVRREVVLKYRGSVLGLGWSFLYPLLLLAAFTLVFGGVFGGRWGEGSEGRSGIQMALFIYCGLAVFTPFAEVITNAPRLLLSNQNFVKKII